MAERWGRVLQNIGGFYTVAMEGGREIVCRARGRLRRTDGIYAGDLVKLNLTDDDHGVIEEIGPRASLFERPAIANVDLVVAVMALAQPAPALDLLDRILATAELERVESAVVWNKADLAEASEALEVQDAYRQAGYRSFVTSVRQANGIEALARHLEGRLTVFAGPSGVGKSSLLNAICPGAQLMTQPVSSKVERGKHTTRSVSLLPLPRGGWVADSPGFSTLALGKIDPRNVPSLFPEGRRLGGQCRFNGCFHRGEPGCAVKAAVDLGRIDNGRYHRYLGILNEVEEAFERRF